ncbi:M42 family metallopeptidase [Desnuesiella massiliensis]|uniref:M42 family metallopeptidase n=1 Tax=Desnuesiella massiliensis TaxID=1650662 RepID=UPI0006E22E5A|nr:M42 family metallopeptidase [Desnuesiella massiliensis]
MEEKQVLKELCEAHGPSGREHWLYNNVKAIFEPLVDNLLMDNLNNIIMKKQGSGKGKIMIMAHLDEVFLTVTEILDKGFLKFKANGIDAKTLVSQEVIIHGKRDILGVIGIKPPHLMKDEERNTAINIDNLLIDTGFSEEEIKGLVNIGDFVTIKREFCELLNNNVICKATDDRAGITAMYSCAKELNNVKHDLDVYFVCSAQEEVGHRGAKTASHIIRPDVGIAIDTTFDGGRLGDEERGNKLGAGPVICIGPNIHPRLRKQLMDIAEEYNIPFQVEVEPGNTGTDAWDIQITREGIATLLLSIPIKYMHTSVEMVNLKDIKNTGRIIAKLIEKLNFEVLEEILCF